MDEYHLTKFILESANESITNWKDFMSRVQKMFKKRIVPNKILYGLMRKNNQELSELCIEQLEKNRSISQRLLLLEAEHEVKIKKWIERVNAGNHKAFLLVLAERQRDK